MGLFGMVVDVIIPVKGLRNIKSRLAPILDADGRCKLGLNMFIDVMNAVQRSRDIRSILVVSSDPTIHELSKDMNAETLMEKSERGVNTAVAIATSYAKHRGATGALILPSDIPLITPRDIDRMISMAADERSMVITPSIRYDGTNALLLKPPDVIRTCYENESYTAHIRMAKERGLKLSVYFSKRVMLDIDTPEDVEEFLRVGGDTFTHRFLRKEIPCNGFVKKIKF
ncbi:MAG: 2-phospho-L-lactate guanylyltransferase [Candidatus Bathyarchaeia archaeon]